MITLAQTVAIEKSEIPFLRAAADHPQIRLEDSLREEVLQQWPPNCPAISDRPGVLEMLPQGEILIRQWAKKHNLEYSWVVCHAQRTIFLWLICPAAKAFVALPEVSPPSYQPTLRLPGEAEKAYLKRQEQQFKDQLRDHTKSFVESERLSPKDRGSRMSHYRWAAERNCLRWTFEKIAQKNPVQVTPAATRKAVQRVFKELGILGEPKRCKKTPL